MNKKIISLLLCFCLVLFLPISIFAYSNYIWSSSLDSIYTNSSETNSIDNSLNLESGAAVLIEQNSGKVLYDKNMHEQLRPASVTKVMTILLIMEAIDSGKISYDTQIPCSENASSMGGSQIWLDTTETLSVNDMLKAICVVSANDCTVAMAEYLEGSQEAFVQKMNEKAKELGMNDTCFKNCHGIDEDGHITSAYDIALMSKELLTKHPDITKYTTIYMDSLRNGKSELVNTNKVIRTYNGITGLKTGSTSLALYNLSASATRNDLSLIAVIMKAPTTKLRFAESQKLLDYGFSNYSYIKLGDSGDTVQSVPVNKGIESTINATVETTSGVLIPKGKEKQIEKNIILQDNLSAPIYKGQKIGEITYNLDGNNLAIIDLVASNDVPSIGLREYVL